MTAMCGPLLPRRFVHTFIAPPSRSIGKSPRFTTLALTSSCKLCHSIVFGDLKKTVAEELRLHTRIATQGFLSQKLSAQTIANALGPMTSFRNEYKGAISILDWDHRLPSRLLTLRIYAYYDARTFAIGQDAYQERATKIDKADLFPEFDVPDFDHLTADEAYEIEFGLTGELGRSRLTSAWRRNIDSDDSLKALTIVRQSSELAQILANPADRPTHLGDLEAVSWTPPCESDHAAWTVDVWYLQAFDGQIGSGTSFLVDLEKSNVAIVREFSVRAG